MSIRRKTIKLVMVTALSGLLSMTVMACPSGHEGRLAKALDLTEAQVTQLKGMRQSNKPDKQQQKANMKAIHAKKQALLTNYSEAQAEAIAEEIAAMHKSRVLAKLQHQQALYAMLDDQQKKKFTAMLAKHAKKNKKHVQRDRMNDDDDEADQDD
ncbi:MAG: Spy/CpxP family protein refolding chaperone [Oceanicoccus sp.]|jgi:Spy/CpxP family protein refolding chaperone